MQEGTMNGINKVAEELSELIHCSMRLSVNGKLLICKHDVLFSISRLQNDPDFTWAIEKHSKEVTH